MGTSVPGTSVPGNSVTGVPTYISDVVFLYGAMFDNVFDDIFQSAKHLGGGNGSSEFVCEFSSDCRFHPVFHGQLLDAPVE